MTDLQQNEYNNENKNQKVETEILCSAFVKGCRMHF